MKNLKKIVSSVLTTLTVCTGFAGCGGEDDFGGKTVVEYWASVAMEEAVQIQASIDWYNANNTDNIHILFQNKVSGFDEALDRTLTAGVKGPDLFAISESGVKKKASYGDTGVLENLQSYLDNDPDGLSGITPSALSSYRYGKDKMTVNADDPLYAIPVTMNTAVLSYNASAMKNQGVIIVSVDPEDIDEFNKGGVKDNAGKTKEDYGITWNIRARGFDRWDGTTDKNYVKGTYSDDGKTFTANTQEWELPEFGADGKVAEKMVFNNRIAMSWDEVEDLGRLMTANATSGYYENGSTNKPDTQWGFYTRYWFAYGWGVGGAAIKDSTGEGDWSFALGEETQYCLLYEQVGAEKDMLVDKVVCDGNGRPVFVAENEVATYQKSANQYFSDPLPSQYQAFERFFYQQKKPEHGGLYIGPRQTSDIGGSTELAFFQTEKMCMFGHFETSMLNSASKAIGTRFEWDLAPTPVYKAYDAEGNLVNKGAETTYSFQNTAVAMWNNSDAKPEAYKVMKYLSSGKHQEFVGQTGLRLSPVYEYNYDYFVKTNAANPLMPKNVSVFADTLPFRFQDEATFFADSYWSTTWSNPLNSTYREGNYTFAEFLNQYTGKVNDEIETLKREMGID